MKTLRISSEALHDIETGASFYDLQETGLGGDYVSYLKAEIDSLRAYLGQRRLVYHDYQRHITKKFHSVIYYTSDSCSVQVWAVIDCRRDPKWIQDHLSQISR